MHSRFRKTRSQSAFIRNKHRIPFRDVVTMTDRDNRQAIFVLAASNKISIWHPHRFVVRPAVSHHNSARLPMVRFHVKYKGFAAQAIESLPRLSNTKSRTNRPDFALMLKQYSVAMPIRPVKSWAHHFKRRSGDAPVDGPLPL